MPKVTTISAYCAFDSGKAYSLLPKKALGIDSPQTPFQLPHKKIIEWMESDFICNKWAVIKGSTVKRTVYPVIVRFDSEFVERFGINISNFEILA